MIDLPVALVTGGARGIGRATVLELAARGYAVAINYCTSAEAAEELVTTLEGGGRKAIALAGDVGVAGDRRQLVERTLSAFGRLDVLVNNAGITSPGRLDLLEATEENWDRVFATNLKGPFFLSQLAARSMIALVRAGSIPRGTIVNVSSISAYAVSTDRADYCLAKAAMEAMTWLFAARLAEENIRVFEVCPGVIATDMTAPVREKYDRLLAEGLAPMRRWGEPEDVARGVAALCSGELSYSTGQRIHIDGGFHIRRL